MSMVDSRCMLEGASAHLIGQKYAGVRDGAVTWISAAEHILKVIPRFVSLGDPEVEGKWSSKAPGGPINAKI